MAMLARGAVAPDFTLASTLGESFTLSETLECYKFIVLIFYPAAFSSVCTDELAIFQEFQEEFTRLGAITVGLSVDNKHSQLAFAKQGNITFPLLADFHPKGAVAESYGVMRDDGVAERALFIVDATMIVQFSDVSEPRVNPGADGVLARLEELQADEEAWDGSTEATCD